MKKWHQVWRGFTSPKPNIHVSEEPQGDHKTQVSSFVCIFFKPPPSMRVYLFTLKIAQKRSPQWSLQTSVESNLLTNCFTLLWIEPQKSTQKTRCWLSQLRDTIIKVFQRCTWICAFQKNDLLWKNCGHPVMQVA